MGMKETFGEDGFEIREMPTGDKISIDRFSEFQHAFEVFKKTKQFEEELKISVANDTLPILFVEGESDKIILTNAWSKLYPTKSADFHIVNAFDCYFIQNTFLRGDVFKNNPNRVFVGLLDFDSAYAVYEKVKEKKITKYLKTMNLTV
jgi:glutathionyl-hydroquinone reductase